MIIFKQIRDWRRIWELCNSTGQISRLFDDGSGSRQSMKRLIRTMVENPNNLTYEIWEDKLLAGSFSMIDLKDGVFEVHILLKQGFRGSKGIYIGKCGTDFALRLPNVKRLVSYCPETLRESFVFALRCGWKSLGVLPYKWVKNGVAHTVKGVMAERGIPCLN